MTIMEKLKYLSVFVEEHERIKKDDLVVLPVVVIFQMDALRLHQFIYK